MILGEEEFLQAFSNIVPVTVIEDYRAYYDAEGCVTGFAGSGFPDGDNWISIDRELYITHNWTNLHVVDGKIVYIAPVYYYHFSLTRGTKGVKVVKYHAGLVVESDEEYTDIEYYDKRNN